MTVIVADMSCNLKGKSKLSNESKIEKIAKQIIKILKEKINVRVQQG
jgi:hypothetical protein